jgi:N-dimethylarginine dimethylaminohydrolase
MSRPDFYAISEASNPFSRQDAVLDLPLAIRQWEQLCHAFNRAGLGLRTIEPKPGLDDMCFTASQAFVGIDRDGRSFAVPSRMLHSSRRAEIEHAAHWYEQQGYRIIDLELGGEEFLEGASDLLWNPDWESVWAGCGHRSSCAAVQQFAEVMGGMGFSVRTLEMVDPQFYHLNLCLAPLAPESLMLYPGALSPATLTSIRNCAQVYEVSREDALQFVCNGVSVNGYYITSRLTRRLEQVLGSEGIEPLLVDLSEFHKSGRSVASLKMLLP